MLESVRHSFDGSFAVAPTSVVWLQIGSDLFIALACAAIATIVFYFTLRRELAYPRFFATFAAFALACGIVHTFEAASYQYPIDRLLAGAKFFAAVTSWIAALALIPLLSRSIEPMVESSRPLAGLASVSDTTLHRIVAPSKWNRWNDYIVAVLVGILVLLVRASIDPLVEHDYLFVMALLGVVIVAWRSGFGPGLLTLLLSMFGMLAFFVNLNESPLGNLLATGMFFFCGVCCTGLGEAQWVARRRTKAALAVALERKADLEVEVSRRREAELAIRQREAESTELNRKLAAAQGQTAAALAQLESLILNAPVGIALLDRDARFISANSAFLDLSGRSFSTRPAMSELQLADRFPAELASDCRRVLESGVSVLDRRLSVRTTEGGQQIWQVSSFPVMGSEGKSIGLGMVGQNVTERERAADALRESEERFRNMTDSVPVLIWVTDTNPEHPYFNKTWLEFTGRKLNVKAGDAWSESIHPEDRPRYLELYYSSFASRREFEVEYRLRRYDGEYRWVLARATPRFTPGGAFAGFSGLCLDLTDRKEAEEAVVRSERNLTDFFENANVGLHWGTEDGTIIRANRAELQMLGYAFDEYIGRPTSAFHTDPAVAESILARLRAGERVDNCSAQLRCKDGGLREVLISSTALWERGRLMHTRTFTRDITEQKKVEEHLRASEIRYRTLTEAIPQLIWNAGADGRATYFNRRWLDYTGMTLEESQGWGWIEAIHPDDREAIRRAWQATVWRPEGESGERFSREFRLLCGGTGEYRWYLSVVVPLRHPSGEVDQWIGSMADIHDRKTAAEAVAASERLYRAIGESIDYGVWTADGEGKLTYASPSFLQLLGTTLEECSEFGWVKSLHPDDAESTLAAWKECVRTGSRWSMEHRFLSASGRWHPILARGVPITDANGRATAWVGINLDIADQKRAEQDVRDREARFRSLTEAIPQIVMTANPAGSITFFNRRWSAYTGQSLSPGDDWDWFASIHPDDLVQFRHNWQLAVAREAYDFSAEFRLRRSVDGAYRWMLANAISLRDSSGSIVEWVGSIADIDDQKRQAETLEKMVRERTKALLDEVEERKRVEQQLRAVAVELGRSNGELEQFAYVASHDLQEPLRKIQAFGDRLRNKCGDSLPEIGKDYVERMHVSAARMRRLIDDLLTFSRVTTQARPFVRVDLEKLVREVVSDLDEYIDQSGAKLEIDSLPSVDADPSQMRQLFQNLIANAIKFQRPGEPPVIAIWSEPIAIAPADPGGREIQGYRIAVRDNGIGFDEKYLDRIFQVFQRLHGRDEYEGTGVGLAICRKIVERHGGTITAQSRVGEGATFVVVIPIRQSAEEVDSDVRTN